MSISPKQIKADVLIVGAGLIGSATAMGLAKLGVKNVVVVDLDLSGEWSSSELNAGGVRATWSQKVNLLTSKLSIEYFESIAEQVGYHASGYLWLYQKDAFPAALKAREMHVSHGWQVDVLDVAQIKAKAPFIDKTDDLVGGLLGVRDGLVNPNRLKEHYREEAMRCGVQFLDGVFVVDSESVQGKSKIQAFQFKEGLEREAKKEVLTQNPKNKDAFDVKLGEWIHFEPGMVVNAAGAWAPKLAQILGYSCASQPVRRQISLFHARDLDLTKNGMIIDPSGVYFHPESIYGLAGFATLNEPPGFNFDYDGERFFEEYIWSVLYERSTAMESLKHVSGWAGLYENSPDHHAIIGRVESSTFSVPVFEAHSFSGHGAMQSYGVGIALAELMVKGRYETLDLSELAGSRFKNGKAIPAETWVI